MHGIAALWEYSDTVVVAVVYFCPAPPQMKSGQKCNHYFPIAINPPPSSFLDKFEKRSKLIASLLIRRNYPMHNTV